MALKESHRRFVEAFLLQPNATAAYRAAGFKAKGNAAQAAAYKILHRRDVQDAIEAAQAARSERLEMTQDRVLHELAKIALTRATNELTFRDRLRALQLLGQHLGLFSDRLDLNVSGRLDTGSMTEGQIKARLREIAKDVAAQERASGREAGVEGL